MSPAPSPLDPLPFPTPSPTRPPPLDPLPLDPPPDPPNDITSKGLRTAVALSTASYFVYQRKRKQSICGSFQDHLLQNTGRELGSTIHETCDGKFEHKPQIRTVSHKLRQLFCDIFKSENIPMWNLFQCGGDIRPQRIQVAAIKSCFVAQIAQSGMQKAHTTVRCVWGIILLQRTLPIFSCRFLTPVRCLHLSQGLNLCRRPPEEMSPGRFDHCILCLTDEMDQLLSDEPLLQTRLEHGSSSVIGVCRSASAIFAVFRFLSVEFAAWFNRIGTAERVLGKCALSDSTAFLSRH